MINLIVMSLSLYGNNTHSIRSMFSHTDSIKFDNITDYTMTDVIHLLPFSIPSLQNAVSSRNVKSSTIDTLIYDEVRDLVVFRICIVDIILFVIRMSLMIISRGDT